MVDVIVSGHMCLDLLPGMSTVPVEGMSSPGKLFEIEGLDISTGGAVSNTGLALHRLGVDVGLMANVGGDMIGRILIALFKDRDPRLAEMVHVREGEASSYSILMSPQNKDRIIFHCTGTNEVFGPDSVDFEQVAQAKIFHLGYPPLLPGLLVDDGAPLVEIFKRAKATGVVTSLDTAMPGPNNLAGRVDWHKILGGVLPYVDVFVPSMEEITFMLHRDKYDAVNGDVLPTLNREMLVSRAEELIGMGAAITGFKLSSYGLYLHATGDKQRLAQLNRIALDVATWAGASAYHPALQIDVVGTTGAGDAAYAGIMAGLLRGVPPGRLVAVANALGALNVQQADATSGLLTWDETLAKLDAGWPTAAHIVPGF